MHINTPQRLPLHEMPSYKDKLTWAETVALALYVSKASDGAR